MDRRTAEKEPQHPEVQAFQTYLSTDTWANEKATATPDGGWVSANTGLDVANLGWSGWTAPTSAARPSARTTG